MRVLLLFLLCCGYAFPLWASSSVERNARDYALAFSPPQDSTNPKTTDSTKIKRTKSAKIKPIDSAKIKRADSILKAKKEAEENRFLTSSQVKNKNPWIAGALSIIPGVGQIYNGRKHYWKGPAYFLGVGALLLAVQFNQERYNSFRDAYTVYKKQGWEQGIHHVDDYVKRFFEYRDSTNLLRAADFYLSQRDFWVMLSAIGWVINVLDAIVYAHLSGFDIGKSAKLYIRPKFPRYDELIAGTSYGGISIALTF